MGQYLKGVDIMAEIFDINSGKKLSSDKEVEQAAMGLAYLFDMPDEMFKMIYPQMKEEFLKTVQNGEFEKEIFQQGVSDKEKQEAIDSFKELQKEMEEEGLCQEKLDFLTVIRESMENVLNSVGYRDTVTVAVEFCHPNAKEPTYANPDDAGCDVYAVETTHLAPGATMIVRTGLKVAVPAGWMLSVRPRSGMSAKTGIRVANAPGTIDTGYRDEVGIILHNTGNEIYTINAGDRIAQFVIEPAPMIKFKKVDSVEEIGQNRGGGFGHTGH